MNNRREEYFKENPVELVGELPERIADGILRGFPEKCAGIPKLIFRGIFD